MTVGVWKTLAELEDPELRKLAASLPRTVMHSWADSMAQKYMPWLGRPLQLVRPWLHLKSGCHLITST